VGRRAPLIAPEVARRIRLVGLDVDGVLTEGGIYLGSVGDTPHEFKRYDIQDGLGIHFLRRAGIRVAIVTGRVSESVRLRARELEIEDVSQDAGAQKLPAFTRMLEKHGIQPSEAAFIADDFPDVPVLKVVGLPVAVGNAVPEVRALCSLRLERGGGAGAVREFAELLLKARGEWKAVTEAYVAVALMRDSKGRVIVAGVGKSGLIARKIAATLTSTGTPAYFLHPTDSVHGDLGIVGGEDVAILISKSGESDELFALVEHLKRLGVRLVALTGERGSGLAKHADVVIDASVTEEACPHDLAPTTSTTVALALGDALAVALLEEKGFRREDFARLHPGGSIGRRLLTHVSDVMERENLPVLHAGATMRQAIVLLAERRGIAIMVDKADRVAGVMTAGDLTRMMERETDIMSVPLERVLNPTPKTARHNELASAVVFRMETHGIMAMPVLGDDERLAGVVHLHDLMRARIA
jgi:arabinose-5-phosphate isomerase